MAPARSPGAERVGQAGHLQHVRQVLQVDAGQALGHGLAGLAPARLDHLQGVLHARAAGQRRALRPSSSRMADVHIHLPGPAQGPGQPLQFAALALEARIEARLAPGPAPPAPAGRPPALRAAPRGPPAIRALTKQFMSVSTRPPGPGAAGWRVPDSDMDPF